MFENTQEKKSDKWSQYDNVDYENDEDEDEDDEDNDIYKNDEHEDDEEIDEEIGQCWLWEWCWTSIGAFASVGRLPITKNFPFLFSWNHHQLLYSP